MAHYVICIDVPYDNHAISFIRQRRPITIIVSCQALSIVFPLSARLALLNCRTEPRKLDPAPRHYILPWSEFLWYLLENFGKYVT